MKIKNVLWILPFLSFIAGYFFLKIFLNPKVLMVPNFIGQEVQEAIKCASDNRLNLKVIGEKIDPDLLNGTIVSQIPVNQKVKANQSIYILLSKKPANQITPEFRGKKLEEIETFLSSNKIKSKNYFLLNSSSICIAQQFQPGENIKNKIILYFGSLQQKPIIFPSLKGVNLKEVEAFMKTHVLQLQIYSKNNEAINKAKNYIVTKQNPLAGTIVKTCNLSTIQIEVEPED